jgi:hypothetical protein
LNKENLTGTEANYAIMIIFIGKVKLPSAQLHALVKTLLKKIK